MKKTLAILLSLALVICMMPGAVFADTEGGGQDDPQGTSPVSISDASVSLSSDAGIYACFTEPEVTVKLNGKTLNSSDFEVTWTPKQLTAASDAGTYTATVTGKGENYEGTASAKATYTVKPIDLARAAIVLKAGVEITSADVSNGSISTNLSSLVKVMQDGADVTARCTLTSKVSNGTAYITASAEASGDGNILKSSVENAFPVKTRIDTGDYVIDKISDQTYTGSAVEPVITVRKANTYTRLTKGTDYTVVYSNNLNATSNAKVTVKGIGNYTGELTQSFIIAQKSLKSSGIEISAADAAYNNGKPVNVRVIVKDGDKTLTENKDYTLTCTSTAIGTGTVSVTGMGNYKDTVTKNFNIVDAKNEISNSNTWVYIGGNYASQYKVNYNGQAQTPDITVYVGSSLSTASVLSSYYYNVTYSENVKPGTASIIITGRNGYAGIVTEKFTISETELNKYNTVISGYDDTYTYTGESITPKVTVKVNGITLTQDKDYTVKYSNNKNQSTAYSKAKIYITAIAGSGYTGSVIAEFSIAGKRISECTASFTNGQSSSPYTGSVIRPAITVKDGSYTTLKENVDYTISYKDASGKAVTSMKDAGTYTVVITGKGNYSGELTLTYKVIGIDISNYTVTLKESSVDATGYAQKPTIVSVKYGATAVLKSTDYEVTYQDADGKTVTSMMTPGTYKVIVTGRNGYSGSTYATFTIVGTPQELKIDKTSYKVYKDSASFRITASWTGDGTGLSFVSSDPSVATVSPSGVVTVHKIGRAKITVTTTGMIKSEAASDDVYVKVYPDKTTLTRKPFTEGKKGAFRVRWDKQDDVTYYEIRYARNSSFKEGTYLTKTVKASELNYATQSTQISNLYSGCRYYVKVRAVKVVYNDYGKELKYYGKWSNWRSVVTK